MKHVRNQCPACGGRFDFLEQDIGLLSICPHCKFQVLLQPPPQARGIFGGFFKQLFAKPHKRQENQPSLPTLPSPEAKEVPSPTHRVSTAPIPSRSSEDNDASILTAGKRELILVLEPLIPEHFRGDRSLIKSACKDADIAAKTVETFCQQGEYSYHCDDRGGAVFKFVCAVEIDPDCYRAWHNIAVIFNDLGDYDHAVQASSFGIQANPNHLASWLGLGTLHLSRKRYREAVSAFRHSTEIQPTSSEAWSGLGTALAKSLQYAAANDALRRAVELKPDDVTLWKDLAAGLLVESEYDAALEATQMVLKLTPDDTEWQNVCAILMNPSRKSFYAGLRYYIVKEHLERERGIKLDQ
jgi:tetratricopeptide (TPR) repeat protein